MIVKEGPKIAQEDITCWKVVKKFNDIECKEIGEDTTYPFNETLMYCEKLKVETISSVIGEYSTIKEGFKVYTSQEYAKSAASRYQDSMVVKCTIPKGSEYCFGAILSITLPDNTPSFINSIISTQIIIHKP